MTTYRDGKLVSPPPGFTSGETAFFANIDSATSGQFIQYDGISLIGAEATASGDYATHDDVSTALTSYMTLSSVQTIFEFNPSSFDLVSGADWKAGATATASSAIDTSAPSISVVAMASGQGVGFGIFVPIGVETIAHRIISRSHPMVATSGEVGTYTLFHRNLGGAWSGIITTTANYASGSLTYVDALTSSALTNLPVIAGAFNQFEIARQTAATSISGLTYVADYQLTFK